MPFEIPSIFFYMIDLIIYLVLYVGILSLSLMLTLKIFKIKNPPKTTLKISAIFTVCTIFMAILFVYAGNTNSENISFLALSLVYIISLIIYPYLILRYYPVSLAKSFGVGIIALIIAGILIYLLFLAVLLLDFNFVPF
jgi:hypothetical protein